jgi:hypothetical protein
VTDPTRNLVIGLKALRYLGVRSLALYTWYRVLIRFPFLLRTTRPKVGEAALKPLLTLPERAALASLIGAEGQARLLAEADEIVGGQVRLFGVEPVSLNLVPPGELAPWYKRVHSDNHSAQLADVPTPILLSVEKPPAQVSHPAENAASVDIKFTWEPGRFGWAYILGRAYLLSGDERYASAFWGYAEEFLQANPPNMGPHWESAQEVALRLIAFVFAAQLFESSPQTTPQRASLLAQAVADCAARIPATLVYARSQNNNHLLVEAAGLYTAALALPDVPQAAAWRKLGWRWFNQGLLDQISMDGAYTQQSANYHRLMLQIALWMASISAPAGDAFLPEVCHLLEAATRWLLDLVEFQGGRVPNLGPNDGAYIFPLALCLHDDYRPVLQAAAQAFLPGTVLSPAAVFPPGPWDEMKLWLNVQPGTCAQVPSQAPAHAAHPIGVPLVPPPPHILGDKSISWAYLRAVQFAARPGHADQLHMDMWWRGINLAMDPGTYLYNAPSPWDNALAGSDVHNTVSVNRQDQMLRAGRFLWLDWAQARVTSYGKASDGSFERLVAQHDGYRGLGVIHQRAVEWQAGSWLVTDDLIPADDRAGMLKIVSARLQWLLPDWPWRIGPEEIGEGMVVELISPYGTVRLVLRGKIPASGDAGLSLQLVRGGELLYGNGPVSPVWGWSSPTYAVKLPALSLIATIENRPPLGFVTRWQLPSEKKK